MKSRQRAVAEQLFCVQRDGSSRWRLTGYITPCQHTPPPSLLLLELHQVQVQIFTCASVQGQLKVKEQMEEEVAFHNVDHPNVATPSSPFWCNCMKTLFYTLYQSPNPDLPLGASHKCRYT